ncbi:acetolactate synthase small subunit [Desulfoferrobacter suflitae]|uniref:acetolactate synthase small subunit n=1 Tax=Desulfoferrobacter suflitae TaxID=2865782 RepID=UPI00216436A2|nr:acetolactate synthase small subunit [Desulfoferrobacter suflitae]MCK8602791.1 acetolactate synthase small subunit [Desulfoferrobacter suflitae]
MSDHPFQPSPKPCESRQQVTLDLTVKNHPGVMSHVCGLFSRRAYNVEGIFCMPIGKGEHSRIRLLVNEDQRLDQMVKQVRKLPDVLDVTCRTVEPRLLEQLQQLLDSNSR